MTVAMQLFAIFAFGLVITGVVFLGVVRAREFATREARAQLADDQENGDESGKVTKFRVA